MHNFTDLIKHTLALHEVKSVPDATDNERRILCACGVYCADAGVENAGDLPSYEDHQAEAVAEVMSEEFFATVNRAAMSIARVALREHSGPPDEKLEAGVKGYLYALRNRELRAEFGEGYFCYPSINDLRNHMRESR